MKRKRTKKDKPYPEPLGFGKDFLRNEVCNVTFSKSCMVGQVEIQTTFGSGGDVKVNIECDLYERDIDELIEFLTKIRETTVANGHSWSGLNPILPKTKVHKCWCGGTK